MTGMSLGGFVSGPQVENYSHAAKFALNNF